jgi:xylulokinase
MWTKEMIDGLDLDEEKFPRFVEFGHRIGAVTAAAASEFQMRKGTPVFAGGPDFIMSILGTAAVKPGRACDRAGTSEGVNICSEQRIDDGRLLCYRHIAPGYWNVAGIISTSGKALEWLRESALGGSFTYESLDQMAMVSEPGAGKLIFLPYLSGERAPIWDPHARGVFFGLALHHDTGDLARAVLESTGFAIRDILSVISEHEIETDELRVAGNPARSDTWNQIKADITGKRILVPENCDSELVGDLCIAMTQLGRFSSAAEAAEQLVRISRIFEPMGENRQLYDELFYQYRDIYQRLKPVFHRVAEIPRRGTK